MKRIFNGKYKITQTYHDRHKGLDVVGLSDKNVRSPIDGVVRSSTLITDHGNLTWEWGNYVRVDDADGNKLYFCHLAARFVKVGQKVKVGDPLGIMGNTGKSFGAHCHFEVRTQANIHKNPADYLGVPNEKTTYEWIKTKSGW
ncbi:MAG: M23 family metallopeptidase, partial [Oscillospiraceae bacterium]